MSKADHDDTPDYDSRYDFSAWNSGEEHHPVEVAFHKVIRLLGLTEAHGNFIINEVVGHRRIPRTSFGDYDVQLLAYLLLYLRCPSSPQNRPMGVDFFAQRVRRVVPLSRQDLMAAHREYKKMNICPRYHPPTPIEMFHAVRSDMLTAKEGGLGFSSYVTKRIEKIITDLQSEEGYFQHATSPTILAGATYLAGVLEWERRTQLEVSEFLGVTEGSVRNGMKEIVKTHRGADLIDELNHKWGESRPPP